MKKAGFVIEVENLPDLVTLVEARCPSLCLSDLKKDFDDALGKATEEESFNFNCMMMPLVNLCLHCKKPFSTNKKPNKATLFTLNGPIPCTKLRLRCRECVWNVFYNRQNWKAFVSEIALPSSCRRQ